MLSLCLGPVPIEEELVYMLAASVFVASTSGTYLVSIDLVASRVYVHRSQDFKKQKTGLSEVYPRAQCRGNKQIPSLSMKAAYCLSQIGRLSLRFQPLTQP